MSIDTLPLVEQQTGKFDRLSTEAITFMEREGYAHIKGLARKNQCEQVSKGFDQEDHFDATIQGQLVESRQQYWEHKGPQVWQSFKESVGKTFKKAAGSDQDFVLWGHKPLYGVQPISSDTFSYQDGADFARHTDDAQSGFPTQIIVTWRGSATFRVFDDMETETPKVVLKVDAGDAVILRGDEKEGGQLPHSVEGMQGDSEGNRMVTSFYPDRDYVNSAGAERYRQERSRRWETDRSSRRGRIAHGIGLRIMAAKRPVIVPESPDTSRYIRS